MTCTGPQRSEMTPSSHPIVMDLTDARIAITTDFPVARWDGTFVVSAGADSKRDWDAQQVRLFVEVALTDEPEHAAVGGAFVPGGTDFTVTTSTTRPGEDLSPRSCACLLGEELVVELPRECVPEVFRALTVRAPGRGKFAIDHAAHSPLTRSARAFSVAGALLAVGIRALLAGDDLEDCVRRYVDRRGPVA